MNQPSPPFPGRCTCGEVRYTLTDTPLIVHACHCRWCQRETGSAFVLNAMIEADRLTVTQGAAVEVPLPSDSGRGQRVFRCPTCQVALWSIYSSPKFRFVRVGTLEEPGALPPDVQIFLESKQPWVQLPEGARQFQKFYKREEAWSPEALARLAALG